VSQVQGRYKKQKKWKVVARQCQEIKRYNIVELFTSRHFLCTKFTPKKKTLLTFRARENISPKLSDISVAARKRLQSSSSHVNIGSYPVIMHLLCFISWYGLSPLFPLHILVWLSSKIFSGLGFVQALLSLLLRANHWSSQPFFPRSLQANLEVYWTKSIKQLRCMFRIPSNWGLMFKFLTQFENLCVFLKEL
jgi:hypothetical protein